MMSAEYNKTSGIGLFQRISIRLTASSAHPTEGENSNTGMHDFSSSMRLTSTHTFSVKVSNRSKMLVLTLLAGRRVATNGTKLEALQAKQAAAVLALA